MRGINFLLFALVLFVSACALQDNSSPGDVGTVVVGDEGSGATLDGGVAGADSADQMSDAGTAVAGQDSSVIVTVDNPAVDSDLPQLPTQWRDFDPRGVRFPDATLVLVVQDLDQIAGDGIVPYAGVAVGPFTHSTNTNATSLCPLNFESAQFGDDTSGTTTWTWGSFYHPTQSYCAADGEHAIDSGDPVKLLTSFFYSGAKYTNLPAFEDVPSEVRTALHRVVFEVYVFDQPSHGYILLHNFVKLISYGQSYESVGQVWWTRDGDRAVANYRVE